MNYKFTKKTVAAVALLTCSAMVIPSPLSASEIDFKSLLNNRLSVLEERIVDEPKNTALYREYVQLLYRLKDAQYVAASQKLKNLELSQNITSQAIAPSRDLFAVPAPKPAVKTEVSNTDKKLVQAISDLPVGDTKKLEDLFQQAKKYEASGDWQSAEKAYLEMLEISPNLDRVKLDLGLLYAKVGFNKNSKKLFEGVLKNAPPKDVEKNINNLLTKVDDGLKKHNFNAVVVIGANSDSNANSASSSGNSLFLDTSLPLTDDSKERNDVQTYAVLSLNHAYNFDFNRGDKFKSNWMSNATLYRAEQRYIKSLDLALVSVKTGPVFYNIKNGHSLGYNLGYSAVAIAGEDYLHTLSNEVRGSYKINQKASISPTFTYEHRYFVNSLDNSTISERTGEGYQVTTAFNYMFTPQDIFDSSVTYRKETTRKDQYDNQYLNLGLGLLHAFDSGVMLNFKTNYKHTEYDAVDPLITATIVREDREAGGGLTLTKKLIDNFTGSLGYEYKKIDSNVENYEYDNHHIGTSLSYNF